MHELARPLVLVADDWIAPGLGSREQPARRSTLPTVEAARPTVAPITCGPAEVRCRAAMISPSIPAGSRRGCLIGVEAAP